MNILQMSTLGSLLILVILLLRRFFLNRLPKDFMFLLWLIVMVRLLVPGRCALPIMSIASRTSGNSAISTSTVTLGNYYAQVTGSTSPSTIPYFKILWIAGGLILFFIYLFQLLQNREMIAQAIPDNTNPVISQWFYRHKAYAQVKILCSDQIASPVAVGIIHKRIIFPKTKDSWTRKELHYILLHELHHLYHYDDFWRFCMMLCLCVHWFNPLVWIAFYTFNNDLEIACDKYVLNVIGREKNVHYAEALIHMAEQFQSCGTPSSGFTKRPVKERIVTIMKHKKTTCAMLFCVIVVLGTSMFVFAKPATTTQTKISRQAEQASESSVEGSLEISTETSTNPADTPRYFTEEEFSDLIDVYRTHKSEIMSDYELDDTAYEEGLTALEWQLDQKKQDPDYQIPNNTTAKSDIEKSVVLSIHAQNYLLEAKSME